MAAWPVTKKYPLLDIENVGQGHYLQKIAASQILYDRFLANFYVNDGYVVILADPKNISQGHRSKNHYISEIIWLIVTVIVTVIITDCYSYCYRCYIKFSTNAKFYI